MPRKLDAESAILYPIRLQMILREGPQYGCRAIGAPCVACSSRGANHAIHAANGLRLSLASRRRRRSACVQFMSNSATRLLPLRSNFASRGTLRGRPEYLRMCCCRNSGNAVNREFVPIPGKCTAARPLYGLRSWDRRRSLTTERHPMPFGGLRVQWPNWRTPSVWRQHAEPEGTGATS